MRLGKLTLHNYLSYNSAEIDFSKIRKALVSGSNNGDATDSNGAGKTNLFESLGWNGWGESKAETIDLNVKHDKEDCSVQHDFEHDGKEVSIIRARNKKTGTTTLDFIIDGVVSNGTTVTDTNKKIQDFLNLDYETFINSVYIKQDDVHSLANTKNSNAGRELLEKVLNLAEYEDYYDKTKLKIKDLDDELAILNSFLVQNSNASEKKLELLAKIESSKNELTEKSSLSESLKIKIEVLRKQIQDESTGEQRLIQLQKSLTIAENDLVSASDSYETSKKEAMKFKTGLDGKISDLELKISKESELLNSRNSLDKEEDEIKRSLDEIKLKEASIVEINKLINDAQSSISAASEKKFKAEHERGTLLAKNAANEAKIKSPRIKAGERCGECATLIDDDNLDHFKIHLGDEIARNSELVEKLNSESINPLREEIKGYMDRVVELEIKIKAVMVEIDATRSSIRSLETIRHARELIEKELMEINTSKPELDKLTSGDGLEYWKTTVKNHKGKIQQKQEEVESLKTEISEVVIDSVLLDKLKKDLSDNDSALNSIRDFVSELKANIKTSESEANSFDIIISESVKKRLAADKIMAELSVYNDLSDAFSSKGIRSYILENAIAELEKEANGILAQLSNGRLALEFKTKKEVKKAKSEKQEKLTFEVLINDGHKTFPFSSYSGGEKFRISFVLRVALSKILLRRANSKLEFLIIDEAVSPLDRSGVEKIMEVINNLQDDFKTILVITHRDDIKNYFDEVININNTVNGSSVESVGV